MRIYIAGPMTGLPESNYPAFNEAAAAWRAVGWDVCNPAEHFGGDQRRKYTEYVEADLAALKTCDAIAMLPNWDAGHSGAIWEHFIARDLLDIVVYDALNPVPHVNDRPQTPLTLEDWQRERVGPQVANWVDQVFVPITRNQQGALGRWPDMEENGYGQR